MTTSVPAALRRARGLEHGVGLADAGGGAEEDAQLARAAPGPPRPGRAPAADPGSGRSSAMRCISLDRLRVEREIQLAARSRAARRARRSVRPSVAAATSCRTASSRQAALARHARAPGTRPRPARCAGRARCRTRSRDRPAPAACCRDRPRAARRCGRCTAVTQGRIGRALVRAGRHRAVVRHTARSPTAGPRNTSALENGWPIRREPTALPSTSTTLPLALVRERELRRSRVTTPG